jgi:hypothetical protein
MKRYQTAGDHRVKGRQLKLIIPALGNTVGFSARSPKPRFRIAARCRSALKEK